MRNESAVESSTATVQWAKVLDHESCIGCHACTTACKSENEVPLSVTRTYVKYVDVGFFPQARRAFQVTRCNQCEAAPCAVACPTAAMYKRDDGIVDFDKQACIGCKACIAACPYDAIFINPEDGAAEKCNFCAHRIDIGLEPACVVVCPTEAIVVGDLLDPQARVSQLIHRHPVAVRRPEKETRPKVYYRGAHQATLDPLAARRPAGGLFLWSEQKQGGHHVVSGHPDHAVGGTSSAEALLSYDVPHSAPWDWRVSLYTLTKGIAAGVYLLAALMVIAGRLPGDHPLWRWGAPLVAGLFLALTGCLLLWDLEHPQRFYKIFTRPQWKSWLVRGAFIIAGYGAVLGLHLLAGEGVARWLMIAGIPLAAMSAIYTAYLFAQAKARDLWQSPLLPPHLLVQAFIAGSAALLCVDRFQGGEYEVPLSWLLAVSCLIHLGFVWGEATLPHGTAHARLAIHEMVHGRFKFFFWAGALLIAGAVAAPWIGIVAAPLALVGLFAAEHAYVQAGQAVPLA